jgi:hypothetical protein
MESRKARFAEIDTRVSASRKSLIRDGRHSSRCSHLVSAHQLDVRAVQAAFMDRIRSATRLLSELLFTSRNFRQFEIGRSKERGNILIGSAVYRFTRLLRTQLREIRERESQFGTMRKRVANYCESAMD